jgi:hypothetical protein
MMVDSVMVNQNFIKSECNHFVYFTNFQWHIHYLGVIC